jgi:SAM-dependent methyltransferase
VNPEYRRLYKRYLKEAFAVDGHDKVILKTDCNNEYFGHPDEKGRSQCPLWGIAPLLEADTHVVDIDLERIEICREAYGSLVKFEAGDIRRLPYKEKTFDAVLDFSTIDHIPFEDWEKALREYRRVLKDGGDLVLVAWTEKDFKHKPDVGVYYYARYEFDEMVRNYFNVSSSEILIEDSGELIIWRGKKSGLT